MRKIEAQEIAIIDCRVSDPAQLKGGSLELQEMAGRMLAEKNNWIIDKVFRKSHSATTTERDDIEEVLKYVKKRKKEGVLIKHYISKSLDRFTRMGDEVYWPMKRMLESEGMELIDTTGIIQPKRNSLEHISGDFKYSWSVHSPSEAAEMMEAYKGKAEVRDILTRMIGAEISLVQDGYAVRRALDGFKNTRIKVGAKDRIIREPNERAHFYEDMFTMLGEGLSEQEVIDKLNAEGFKTQQLNRWDRTDKENPTIIGHTGGNPMTVKQLQRSVQKTEYAGVICEKWTKYQPVRAQYKGLVSIPEFNKANKGKIFIKEHSDGSLQILHNYSPFGKILKHRLKDNPAYPMKFVPCPICGREMLGSHSTGRSGQKFPAYHCGGAKKGKRAHEYYRVKKDLFETTIRDTIKALEFESEWLAGWEATLLFKYRIREKEIVSEAEMMGQNVVNLKIKQRQKLETFEKTESPVIRKMIEEEIEALDLEIKGAEKVRNDVEITEKGIKSFIWETKYLMEHSEEMLIDMDNMEAQRALFGLVFTETPTYSDFVNRTLKLEPILRLSQKANAAERPLVTPRRVGLRFQA